MIKFLWLIILVCTVIVFVSHVFYNAPLDDWYVDLLMLALIVRSMAGAFKGALTVDWQPYE